MNLGESSMRGILCGIAFALLTAILAACANPSQDATPSGSSEGIVGRSFIWRYDSGVEIAARFDSETQMSWEGLKGPAAGKTGVETIITEEVAPSLWFLSWLEKEGDFTVSQAVDLANLKVASFVTWPSPEGRKSSYDHGTLTETTRERAQ